MSEEDQKLHHLTDCIYVVESTIVEHATTSDRKGGYLLQDGTNRTLCTGSNPDGSIIFFVRTNANDYPLCEGEELDFLRTISDLVDGKPDIETGIVRLTDLATSLTAPVGIWDDAGWLRERIEAAKNELIEIGRTQADWDAVNSALAAVRKDSKTE